MRRFVRDNSLSLVLFLLFFLFVVPQSLAGHREYNQDQQDHQQPEVTYVEYLGEGHFVESIFENWESEFLQIFGYVLLTAYFRQKGSPESKKLDGDEPVDADPAAERQPRPHGRSGAAAPGCAATATHCRSPSPCCSSLR